MKYNLSVVNTSDNQEYEEDKAFNSLFELETYVLANYTNFTSYVIIVVRN